MMRSFLLALFFIMSFTSFAQANQTPQTDNSKICIPYIARAEQAYQIPRGLLLSIAYVESGYKGLPWPWTLNQNGEPYYLNTYQDALKKLVDKEGNARSKTAVGCMQVFTDYHADQFPEAKDMLDPRYNVYYAAKYLRELYQQTGSWTKAVGRYHASKPEAQIGYICKVVKNRIGLRFQKPNQWYYKNCIS